MKPLMRLTLFILMASLSGPAVHAYPIDGYPDTGIRRVEGARMAQEGLIGGSKQPPGALLTTDQVDLRLVDHKALELPEPDPAQAITWIVPPGPHVSKLLRGDHENLAVRITINPVAKMLCEAVASPLVSTSANLSGKPTARNRFVLQRQFANVVDYVVPGDCGPADTERLCDVVLGDQGISANQRENLLLSFGHVNNSLITKHMFESYRLPVNVSTDNDIVPAVHYTLSSTTAVRHSGN